MSGVAKDYSNKKFNNWLVISRAANGKNRQVRWLCMCDCGTIRSVSISAVVCGTSKSCGCLPIFDHVFDRLWMKVRKNGPFWNGTRCWIWKGLRTGNYGQIGSNWEMLLVHRVAYESVNGPIPSDKEIDHLCRRTLCCNPAHLEAVTHLENMRRSRCPTMVAHLAGTCVRGHKMTPENTDVHFTKQNGRTAKCRQCIKDRADKYRETRNRKVRERRAAAKIGDKS